jgi:hypothetical protein
MTDFSDFFFCVWFDSIDFSSFSYLKISVTEISLATESRGAKGAQLWLCKAIVSTNFVAVLAAHFRMQGACETYMVNVQAKL